jgi:hypothetical protein
MSSLHSTHPRARHDSLNVQVVGDEVLVFDLTNETAHALNKPAAFVWRHADGTRTIDEIAREMTREFGASADTQVVEYALQQLQKKHLLEQGFAVPRTWEGMTRRQFLKRATAGAVLLAVVTSIVAPAPVHAQSGCISQGNDCSSGTCCGGLECCEPDFSCEPSCDA